MEFADLLSILFPIAFIQLVGWAVPGPNHLTIITASVTSGRTAGLKAAMGIAAGALTWSLIAVSGIAVIFELIPSTYIALRLFGAGYLVYLGISAFRAVRNGGMFKLSTSAKSPATYAPFRTAYVVMMTNPKAVLFFGSILTAFIPPDSAGWLMILIVVQIGLLGALLNAFAAIFFSSATFVRTFQAASVWMSILFGVLFSTLGVLVAYDVARDYFGN